MAAVPVGRAGSEPAHVRLLESARGVPPALRRGGTAPTPHAADPRTRRRTISSDMVLDTVPMGRVRHRRLDTGPLSSAIVYALPDTASGLRKFDLGTVPASVTPPRSWRRAAWFAVGTSAAVVLGLAVASAELMGRPVEGPMIDALPAYPTGPLTLEKLPNQQTTTDSTDRTRSRRPSTSRSGTTRHSDPPPDTVVGGATD
ncbi:MAG: hypothetical protein LC635_02215, partial [Pseudonocardiaceae bacterium]|nr:hypothetical protein [Pseudonocardiaceae bacterium]